MSDTNLQPGFDEEQPAHHACREDQPPRLLLVDDEAIIALNERRMLERHGFSVEVVNSGEQAVSRAVDDGDIDLILMDIDLGPGIDGTEAARRILARRHVPIVFLTAHAEPAVVERVSEIAGYGYVLKGSGDLVLVQSIRTACRLRRAYRALQRQKERYRSVVENTTDAVIIHDFAGSITFVNHAASRLLGYEWQELLGMHILDIHAASSKERVANFMGKESWERRLTTEQELVTKDGEVIPVEVSAVVVAGGHGARGEQATRDGQGDAGEVQAFVRDIRARKHAEASFRMLYDHTEALIAMWDREGRLLQANPAAARLVGRNLEEIRGRHISEIFPPDSAAYALSRFQEVFRSGRSRTAEWRTQLRGTEHFFLVHTEPITDGAGRVTAVTTYSNEITELKRSTQYYELIAEQVQDVVVVYDGDFRCLYVSPSGRQLFGYDLAELRAAGAFGFVHEEDAPELSAAVQEDQRLRRSAVSREFRVRDKAGRVRWVETRSTYLYAGDGNGAGANAADIAEGDAGNNAGRSGPDRSGELHRVISALRDVTDRHELHERLQRTVGDLQGALAHNERLLREVHHRVKNNLALVSSLISLKESSAPGVDLSDLRNRVDAVRHVHEELESLEDRDAVDVGRYLHSLLSQLFQSLSAHPVEIDMETFDIQLPSKHVVPIGLIVNELATNAVKHAFSTGRPGAARTEGPGTTPATFRVTFRRDARTLILVVSNSGPPLPEEIDLRNPRSLGLQLVTGLAAQLGGTVEVVRGPSPEFTISMPRIDAEAPPS
jgi:PAS domain S-box-containing protein